MNVVVLIGRLVADPELKYTPSGIAVCQFKIAVDRPVKSEGGEKQADFIPIVTWRQSAEYAANYLTKGQRVAVHGSMQSRSWVAQDGQKRYMTEVVANRVQGLDRPRGDQGGEAAPIPEADFMPQTGGASGGFESDADYDPFAEE